MSTEPSGELPLRAPSPSDEAALVARLVAGEEEAVSEMVSACAPRLLAAARRFLRNEEDARDAVQEALVRSYRSIRTFHAGSRLSTWVHRILINGCLMRLRHQRRRPEASIEDLLPRFLEEGHQEMPGSPWRPDVAEELVRKETRQLVRDTIDRLPEAYRTVLLLRDIEELDTAEVAALLSCTENAVKIRLHRARQALRELLAPHMEARPS